MRIPVICGTTSSGKTAFAFDLAKKFSTVNILSVDSRQFYKDLPVVSGQDIAPPGVTIYGQGILSADQECNVADFQKYSSPILKKEPLIIVGGSGLYLKAITSNLPNTKIPPDPIFRQEADKLSPVKLQEILQKLDTNIFESLNNSDKNNPRRLIRHIEILRHKKSHPGSFKEIKPNTSFDWIGLKKSPDQLANDIRSRVVTRLQNGAIEEVKILLKKYPNTKLPIYTTIGVKQIIEFINNQVDENKLIHSWTQSEISYAKRQSVWFKKQPNIIWYDNTNHDQIKTY